MKKNNNKGFTLMEMLIVVAIIAVLVAIAIPVFTNQLEKAREATDAANIRSAYAEVMACALTDASKDECTAANVTKDDTTAGKYTYTATIAQDKVVQKQTGWQNATITDIGGQKVSANTLKGWTITYSEATGKCVIAEVQ